MLWIVDYIDPNNETSDCLVIEADVLFVGLLVAVAVSTVLTSCRNWLVGPKAVPAAMKRSGITSMIVT